MIIDPTHNHVSRIDFTLRIPRFRIRGGKWAIEGLSDEKGAVNITERGAEYRKNDSPGREREERNSLKPGCLGLKERKGWGAVGGEGKTKTIESYWIVEDRERKGKKDQTFRDKPWEEERLKIGRVSQAVKTVQTNPCQSLSQRLVCFRRLRSYYRLFIFQPIVSLGERIRLLIPMMRSAGDVSQYGNCT